MGDAARTRVPVSGLAGGPDTTATTDTTDAIDATDTTDAIDTPAAIDAIDTPDGTGATDTTGATPTTGATDTTSTIDTIDTPAANRRDRHGWWHRACGAHRGRCHRRDRRDLRGRDRPGRGPGLRLLRPPDA
ncbi:MAG: hypothetical protein U5R31_05165 [Acidimicrobiia bacterium]|nr:hypothetical protein [Acidimicrobiia bacterium]